MTRKTFAAAVAASVALPAIAAGPTVTVIDDFTDPFESEQFITIAGNDIIEIDDRSGLDAGRLLVPVSPNNDEVGDPVVITERPFEEQIQTGLSGVLGGTRIGRLTNSDGGSGFKSNAAIGQGVLGHSHVSGARSVLELTYGPDLSFDAMNGFFSLDFIAGDLDSSPNRPVDLTLALTSGDGSSYDQTVTLLTDGETKFFDSSGFGDMGVDLADIAQIDLTFDVGESTATDYIVSNFAFVPGEVPAPGVTALLGLGGLAAARRRRG